MNPRRRAGLVATRTFVLATLGCAFAALLLSPAIASAASQRFGVNSNGDGATRAACEAQVGECTLRGAIEAANQTDEPDEIELVGGSGGPFDGSTGTSEIKTSGLPALIRPVKIYSAPCKDGALIKPCAGIVKEGTGGTVLSVKSSGVTLEDLAVGGGGIGIQDEGEGLQVHGVWLGLDLAGGAQPFFNAAFYFSPGGPDGTLSSGDPATEPRNVITNAPNGVVIAADGATVQGSYIGVGPDGSTLAGVKDAVYIVRFPAGVPNAEPVEDVLIGGAPSRAEAATPACDGPCNVVAGTGEDADIVLPNVVGTQVAGPVAIQGNYIGLAASGTAPIDYGFGKIGPENGILGNEGEACEDGPGRVTVDGNYIEGGAYGVNFGGSESLTITGNHVGIGADGEESVPPTEAALRTCGTGLAQGPKITGNQLTLGPDAIGVENVGGGAEISANTINGSYAGILTSDEAAGPDLGNAISANTITGADVFGIHLQDGSNVVTGNTIRKSGKYGVLVEDGAEHNRIGGDGAGEANTIEEAGSIQFEEGAAILIAGEETSRNEVAANTGFGNFGDFIELIGKSSSETPNGLEPPIVTAASQSSAAGTAAPNTTVRVFTKASTEAGELGTYLGRVEADATGAWKATFAKQPTGTLIAATQTSKAGSAEAGTSEVSKPLAAAADPEEATGGGGGGGGGGTGGGTTGGGSGASSITASSSGSTPHAAPAPVSPATAPKVRILRGPKKSSAATTARFSFRAATASATFECSLDGAKWTKCRSPKTYRNLDRGGHLFRVRAVASGLTGPVAKYRFAVKP